MKRVDLNEMKVKDEISQEDLAAMVREINLYRAMERRGCITDDGCDCPEGKCPAHLLVEME